MRLPGKCGCLKGNPGPGGSQEDQPHAHLQPPSVLCLTAPVSSSHQRGGPRYPDSPTTPTGTTLWDLARVIWSLAAIRIKTPMHHVPWLRRLQTPAVLCIYALRSKTEGQAARTTEINLHLDGKARARQLTRPSSPAPSARIALPSPAATPAPGPRTQQMHSSHTQIIFLQQFQAPCTRTFITNTYSNVPVHPRHPKLSWLICQIFCYYYFLKYLLPLRPVKSDQLILIFMDVESHLKVTFWFFSSFTSCAFCRICNRGF